MFSTPESERLITNGIHGFVCIFGADIFNLNSELVLLLVKVGLLDQYKMA